VYKYPVEPAHKLNLSAFQALSKTSKTIPDKMSTIATADPVKDLTTMWNEMFENDPILKALREGKMSWADVPDDDEPVAPLPKPTATTVSTASTDYVTPPSTPKKYSEEDTCHGLAAPWAPKRAAKKVAFPKGESRRASLYGESSSVPPVVPGRKTLMAKNLPRDITVQQLRTIFEKYGATKDIYIPKNMDRSSPYFGTIKGFAKIAFLKADSAASAFTSEYGRITISGKNVALEFANEDR
jgi:hypothetical protein